MSVLKGFSSAVAELHAPKLSDLKQELAGYHPLCPICSVGQVVKTPLFHGSNTGSIPVPSTKGIFPVPRSGKPGRGRGDERIALLCYFCLVSENSRWDTRLKDSCPVLLCGSSSIGRAPAFQAGRCGFKSHLSLQIGLH